MDCSQRTFCVLLCKSFAVCFPYCPCSSSARKSSPYQGLAHSPGQYLPMDDADEELRLHLPTSPVSIDGTPSRMTSSPVAMMEDLQRNDDHLLLLPSSPVTDPIAHLDLSPITTKRVGPFSDDCCDSHLDLMETNFPECQGMSSKASLLICVHRNFFLV